ncbi:MAG: adenylate kinase [Candidatus Dormibacteria bacterium]
MKRVSVVGNSGSGKSALAARLARQLGVPHVELDSIFHLAGWEQRPEPEFRDLVLAAARADGWVIDGNYHAVRELVWERADTVVWLDLPRHIVMRRIIWRTLTRLLLRRRLWNGNRERLANLLSRDPEKSIIAWSWTRHREYAVRYAAAMADPRWAGLRFVRVQSPRAAGRLIGTAVAGDHPDRQCEDHAR